MADTRYWKISYSGGTIGGKAIVIASTAEEALGLFNGLVRQCNWGPKVGDVSAVEEIRPDAWKVLYNDFGEI